MVDLVERLWRLHMRGVSYASDTPAVDMLLADLSGGIADALAHIEKLEAENARLKMSERRTRILTWMEFKRQAKGNKPVLFSEAKHDLGIEHGDEAFEALIRDGVIESVCPEAKPGDSGRQFWDFAHWAAQPQQRRR